MSNHTRKSRHRVRQVLRIAAACGLATVVAGLGLGGCAGTAAVVIPPGAAAVKVRLETRAPDYRFGDVHLLVDEVTALRPQDRDGRVEAVSAIDPGPHRLDARLEYRTIDGVGDGARAYRRLAAERSTRFTSAPGCTAHVSVILEQLAGPDPAVRLEVKDCAAEGAAASIGGETTPTSPM